MADKVWQRLSLGIFTLSLITAAYGEDTASEPWRESFDRNTERARAIRLMYDYPMPELQIGDLSEADSITRAFLAHFESKIWPKLRELPELTRLWWDPPGGRIEIFENALNRALYDSEEEKAKWEADQEKMAIRHREILSSPEWQQDVARWAEIGERLKGELPDLARRMKGDLEINEFTPAELPLLEEIEKISVQRRKIFAESPFAKNLAPTEKRGNEIAEAFHRGEKSFDDAWKELEELQKEGRARYGQDIAEKAKDLNQRSAELKTELAKRKGHKTWASYVMSTYARLHADGLKTPEEWRAFLTNILDKTKDAWLTFLDKRTKALGVSFKDLRPSQLTLLLLPGSLLIRSYFPAENVEKFWLQTMKESGFNEADLKLVHLDMFPREKKYTHAYLSYNVPRRPKIMKINTATLAVDAPSLDDADAWIDPSLDIILNTRNDGFLAYTTMLHEGGHGLEHAKAKDIWGHGHSNAYAETHSMGMELLMKDPLFVLAKGLSADGKTLDLATVERALNEDGINSILNLRRMAASSLMDLELWDHEFSATAEQFNDRLLRLNGEALKNISQIVGPGPEGSDLRYRAFSTDHLTSGDVRNWGYSGAEIAAPMVFEHVLNILEKETGRRSFLNQPRIAEILIKGLYEHGGEKPFPLSIEEFSGAKFSPDAAVRAAIKAVEGYNPCSIAVSGLAQTQP